MHDYPSFPHPMLQHLRPCMLDGVLQFPVYAMRGGTSTGAVLRQPQPPPAGPLRDELIRLIMGVPLHHDVPGDRQLTGLGRGTPTSNKVFLVEVDAHSREITSTLAQLAPGRSAIDWSVNCGNMSAALPLFALDSGLLPAGPENGDLRIAIQNRNTDSALSAQLQRVGGRLAQVAIPGVMGYHPGVDLHLHHPAGAKTGALLPTGRARDTIFGVTVSCVDVAVPMVIVAASELGKRGDETPAELDADSDFKARLRVLWTEAGLRMRLRGDDGALLSAARLAASETMPKVCLVSAPREGGDIAARYFTPQRAHAALAVSGGCCLAAACLVPGTVAHALALPRGVPVGDPGLHSVHIENPAGILTTLLDTRMVDGQLDIVRAAYRRSAQVLMRGHVPLPQASPALLACYGA